MLYSEYYTCPVCGQECTLSHETNEWDKGATNGFYGRFAAPNGELKEPKRAGVCQQLDEKGDRVVLHFVIEFNQPRGKVLAHHLWRKSGDHAVPERSLEPVTTLEIEYQKAETDWLR